MKNARKVLTKLSEKMDLPSQVTAALPYTAVKGFREVSIDLQKGLLAYSQTEIIVAVPIGTVTVKGEGLHIRLMREGKITVCGSLSSIAFSQETMK